MDGQRLLLDRARSTPLCQPPSPSPDAASGVAVGEDEEERSTVERTNAAAGTNAAADEPVDREEEEEAAALEGEVTSRFAERVGGALDNYVRM